MFGKDRERSLRRSSAQARAPGSPLSKQIEADFVVSWISEESNGERTRGSFQTIVHFDLAEAFALLPLTGSEAKNRLSLLRMFSCAVAQRFKNAIERQGYARVTRLRGKLDGAVFDDMMEELCAHRLIEETPPPKYVRQRAKYWKLTDLGIQRMVPRPPPRKK